MGSPSSPPAPLHREADHLSPTLGPDGPAAERLLARLRALPEDFVGVVADRTTPIVLLSCSRPVEGAPSRVVHRPKVGPVSISLEEQ